MRVGRDGITMLWFMLSFYDAYSHGKEHDEPLRDVMERRVYVGPGRRQCMWQAKRETFDSQCRIW